jgi:nucleolar GTP-binding protein
MVVYNFKSIQVVPTAKDFIDIILSKTQRKTPTEVHKHYKISRIRAFYMRKVKFTSQNYHERLSQILSDFPVLDDIHPFYADLMNVLYDRDHYKLALGQLNVARTLIDNIGKDYVRLLKYGDSLYRCKQLKKAALGRMCTLMKRQGPNLAYLEEVRQHLARLPAIDPTSRSIIICGYPNVGKSSFINKVTRANVDVQPYAFTTKSLFIGHTDHRYLRWQFMDTPGILDHPLEERNTIEMQSITALAHLKATILYILDISEHCGYSIKQQISLFESLLPLFAGKPVVLALNKIDVLPLEKLDPQAMEDINALKRHQDLVILPMSTLTEIGIATVKETACDKLLEMRVEMKMNNPKHMSTVVNRLHTAIPTPRDNKVRAPIIPQSVFEEMKEVKEENPEKEESMIITGDDDEVPDDYDPTVFTEIPDPRKRYLLKDDSWKFDAIPEIYNGMNVADYVDPDIEQKLQELEVEEDEYLQNELGNDMQAELDYLPLSQEEKAHWEIIEKKKNYLINKHDADRLHRRSAPTIPRNIRTKPLEELKTQLEECGKDATKAVKRARSASRSRSASRAIDGPEAKKQKTSSSQSRSRSSSTSRPPLPGEGYRDLKHKIVAEVKARRAMRELNKASKKGEGDRVILNLKPKHLHSGKRGIGKTSHR